MLNGSGRQACLHPEFLALCGYFCMQPVACRRTRSGIERSRGRQRALCQTQRPGRPRRRTRVAGRTTLAWAATWRDQVANVRLHRRPRRSGRSIASSRSVALLRPLPASPSTPTKSCRPWSAPMPAVALRRQSLFGAAAAWRARPLLVRANATQLRVICRRRGSRLSYPQLRPSPVDLPARSPTGGPRRCVSRLRAARHRRTASMRLGDGGPQVPSGASSPARQDRRPPAASAQPGPALRTCRKSSPPSLAPIEYQTYDAAYVETILLQERRAARTAVSDAGPSPAPRTD